MTDTSITASGKWTPAQRRVLLTRSLSRTGDILVRPAVLLLASVWCGCATGFPALIACFALAALGLLTLGSSAPYWHAIVPLSLFGLAAGVISPAATAPALGTVPRCRAGIAAAALNCARQTGSASGVAIFGALIAGRPTFAGGLQAALICAALASAVMAALWVRLLRPSEGSEGVRGG